MADYNNDFEDIEDEYSQINESEKTDALEVVCLLAQILGFVEIMNAKR